MAAAQEDGRRRGSGPGSRRTNLSERLRVQVPFTKGGFATQVADALERAVELAPIVDEGLEGL